MKSKKVILDTNLWISFLITKDYSFIDQFVENKKLNLVFSNELIEEFHAVISRPRLQKHFSSEDIHQLFTIIDKYAKIVEVKSDLRICRDVKDNFLLNLAVDSQADFLVSGDKDLLVLENVQSTRILTMRQLKELLE